MTAQNRLKLSLLFLLVAWMGLSAIEFAQAQQEPPADQAIAKVPELKGASLVRIPLPLSGDVDSKIIASLESISMRSGGNERPVVIIEFVQATSSPDAAAGGRALEQAGEPKSMGQGSSFEKALTISRWLSGPKGNRVKSVGYISSNLRGHAVLVALACEEILMLPDAEIGKAGIDEVQIDPTLQQAYLDIAARRGMFPEAAVRSMLDPSQRLVQLDLDGGGVEYTTLQQLESKPRPDGTWRERTLVPINQMASFKGQELSQPDRRWISQTVNNRELLGVALKLSGPITERPTFSLPRKAVHLKLRGVLYPRLINRSIRAIDDAINNQGADLILIQLDSPGGKLDDSIRLAYRLAEIPSDKAEVVVFVSEHARGDAALIALAADALYMAPNATLGTGGEASINAAAIEQRKTNFIELAKLCNRLPGDLVGLANPDAIVHEFQAADGRQTRTVPDWVVDDPARPLWAKGKAVDYRNGIGVDQAIAMGIASGRENDLGSVARAFAVNELPMEKQTSRLEQAVEWLASQRWLSYVCFLVGLICLSAELSTPGVGIPGLIALVCFMIFFWMNLFQGTIEWLEILLIVAGIGCLLAEIFILPGFGIFGIAGLIMLASGLLLAGQTFTIPTNRYQFDKLVQGMGQLGLGIIVLFGAIVVFHKQLGRLPMFRWFALEHPVNDKFVVAMDRLDEDRQMLKGRFGTTMTRCNPYGKAILGDMVVDVVSKGGWIDEDMPIEVVEVKENQVLIRTRKI
jgi:membrane-bound ClpP family serine protease